MSLSVPPHSDAYAMPVVAETQTGIDRHHAHDEAGSRRRQTHAHGQAGDAAATPAGADPDAPQTVGTLIDVRV